MARARPRVPASAAAAASERERDGALVGEEQRAATVRMALIACVLAAPTTFGVTMAAHLAMGAWGATETTAPHLWVVFGLGLVANVAATGAAHALGVRAEAQGAGGPAIAWALRATPWLAVLGFVIALVVPLLSALHSVR